MSVPVYYVPEDPDRIAAGAGIAGEVVGESVRNTIASLAPGASTTLRATWIGRAATVAGAAASNIATNELSVRRDTQSERYLASLNGSAELVLDVAGSIVASSAVALLLGGTGPVLLVSIGGAIVWTGAKFAFDAFIDTSADDFQLLDANGEVRGGARYASRTSDISDLDGAKDLVRQALEDDELPFPNIVPGESSIRLKYKRGTPGGPISPSMVPKFPPSVLPPPPDKVFNIYDFSLLEVIAKELNISLERLVTLGILEDAPDSLLASGPNTNDELLTGSGENLFIVAGEENRIFVPLPNTAGFVGPEGIDPRVINVGTEGSDMQSVSPAGRQALILGRGGNDTLIGGGIGELGYYFVGGAGNDSILGFGGRDIAIYSGRCEDYEISAQENPADGLIQYLIRDRRPGSPDGTDILQDVGQAFFSNKIVNLEGDSPGCSNAVNLVLVIDVSGSMGDDLDAVKASSSQIIESIFGGADSPVRSRLGIITFNDTRSIQTVLNFTDQESVEDRKSAALSAIDSLDILGGGDEPLNEAILRALSGDVGTWDESLNNNKIIVFSDEPAADPELRSQVISIAQDLNTPVSIRRSSISATKFNRTTDSSAQEQNVVTTPRNSVQILPILIGNDSEAREDFEQLASETNGTVFTASDATEVVDALISAIELPVEREPINVEPTSVDDVVDSAALNQDVTIDVLANDFDSDGDSLSIVSFDSVSAEGGSIRLDDNGTSDVLSDDRLIYTPNTDFTGSDSFTYTVTDSRNGFSVSSVSLAVEYVGTPFFLSFGTETQFQSQIFQPEDIVFFDGRNFSLVFDGSDLGILSGNITGFDFIKENEILLSFERSAVLSENLFIQPNDVLKFTATSLGEETSGEFEVYLDGSDIGLSDDEGAIDALIGLSEREILLSTAGDLTVAGQEFGREDILLFNSTQLGQDSSGEVSKYIDGSDIGLSGKNKDINGATIDELGNLLLVPENSFDVVNVPGDDKDTFQFSPVSVGENTAGRFADFLFFDSSQSQLRINSSISALDFRVGF